MAEGVPRARINQWGDDEYACPFGDMLFRFLTAKPQANAEPADMLQRFNAASENVRGTLLDTHVYAQHDDIATCLSRASISGHHEQQLVWLTGHDMPDGMLAGGKAWVIEGCQTRPVHVDGRQVGHVFEDRFARYCLVTNLLPQDTDAPRTAQAQSVFDRMLTTLNTVGMDFSDVVRTWLYVDQILAWYDDLNYIRNNFFEKHGIFDLMMPASTGVGASNPDRSAIVTNLLAIQPKQDMLKIQSVDSPLQCSAADYKSAFSRAVEVRADGNRLLLVSGTASIEPGGETVHVGDMPRQIELTMRVIHAILTSRGMDWQHVVRGVAYFKDIAQAPLFTAWLKQSGLTSMPLAKAHCDICRDDLLFEVELDAYLQSG